MAFAKTSAKQIMVRSRDGLSLLEVILAMAILGISMVMIGKLYYLGYRSALQARYRSECNMLVDAKMAELASGVLPLESGSGTIDDSPEWSYAVELGSSLQPGLLLATVRVERTNDDTQVPMSVSLTRMIPDPDYEPEEDEG